MSARTFGVGDRIVSGEGHAGVIVGVERCWLTVRWDSDDEFTYCFHTADRWIRHAAAEATK